MNAQLSQLFSDAYAVIWDMDGVLVDSESYHFEAHKQALYEQGITLNKDYYIHHGVAVDVAVFYREIFAEQGKPYDDAMFVKVHYRKLALYQTMQRSQGIKLIQPAYSIVKKLYNRGLLMAVASQVDREEVVRNLRNTGLLEFFPIIVAGGDFGLPKKPAPHIYNKAIELMNVKKTSTVAIEDSSVGARSAVTAGITCLVTPNEYTKDHAFPQEAIQTTFENIAAAIT
jgi:putative hydrolase of the HAD superfamily